MNEEHSSHAAAPFLLACAIRYAGSDCVADGVGTCRGFALCISAWPPAQMPHILSRSQSSLAADRFLLVPAESGNWLAPTKAVRDVPGTAAGLTGMGGVTGGALAKMRTSQAVARFSYAPVLLIAGPMHPLSMPLIWRLLPDQLFPDKA